MICRIVVHEQTPDIKDRRAHQFREWERKQPGFRAGYHVQDPETGKTISTPSNNPSTLVEMFTAVERF